MSPKPDDRSAHEPAQSRTKRWLIGLDIFIGIAALGLIGWGMHHQLTAPQTSEVCKATGASHTVTLRDDQASVRQLAVQHCDRIVIVNKDTLVFRLNFGVHDKHAAYPGYTARTFGPGEQITITMAQAGSFELHDHYRDNAKVAITVAPPAAAQR